MLVYPSRRAVIAAMLLVGIGALGYFDALYFAVAAWLGLALGLMAGVDLALSVAALRGRLRFSRELPGNLTVMRAAPGEHRLTNRSALPLLVQIHEDQIKHVEKRFDPGWRRMPSRSTQRWPLELVATRRGEQELGGASVRVHAGLRLWVLQYRFELGGVVRVYPLIEELTRGDLFAHRRRLYALGQHQSRKFGRGTEFDRLREYSPDDEYRTINWKATARAGKPVVNQYQVEQSRDLILMLDCGRLMHTEIGGRPRLDRYLDAAVHLAYLALSQRDRVGLIAFDAEMRRYVPPQRRPRQLDTLVDAMFDLQPRFVESDYGRAVTAVRTRQPKRGLVVLFTDLLDSLSSRSAVAHLSRLARTHLPLIVVLDDPQVPELAAQHAETVRDVYVKAAAERFMGEKRASLQHLRTRGCLIVNVAAEKLNTALVNEYLEVKAQNIL